MLQKWARYHELGLIKFCLIFLAICDDFLQYPVLNRKWRQTVGYYPLLSPEKCIERKEGTALIRRTSPHSSRGHCFRQHEDALP